MFLWKIAYEPISMLSHCTLFCALYEGFRVKLAVSCAVIQEMRVKYGISPISRRQSKTMKHENIWVDLEAAKAEIRHLVLFNSFHAKVLRPSKLNPQIPAGFPFGFALR